MPLNTQVTLQAFDKWVIDFIGLINPLVRRTRAKCNITMIDYLTS